MSDTDRTYKTTFARIAWTAELRSIRRSLAIAALQRHEPIDQANAAIGIVSEA